MLYKLLTTIIILLAKLRKRCVHDWVLRKERDEHNLIPNYSFSKGRGLIIECCDCGLGHQFYEDEKGIHCIPERPRDYDYKWRLGS